MEAVAVALHIAGAVALLLFGLSMIRKGVEEAFGLRLKMVLGAGTRTGARAFMAGLVATLGLQSSTATALLTASFVKRGMIAGQMAQIVLMGANVGTAITALIVSVGLQAVAPVLILIGYVTGRGAGSLRSGVAGATIGVGLMLLSLAMLEQATEPLRSSAEFAAFLSLLSNAAPVAMVLAAGIAVLCSSSLAAVVLTLSLGLPPGLTIAMVLGANLGGAIPPVLATAHDGAAARRLTLGNLLLRSAGCLLVLPFVDPVGRALAPLVLPQLGLAVQAHVVFNIALAAVAWPFVGVLTRLLAQSMPDEDPTEADRSDLLDDDLLRNIPLALAGARREVLGIGDLAERMLNQTRMAFSSNDSTHLAAVAELENRIDHRQQQVKNYLSRLGAAASEEERRTAIGILDYVINLEHIGDIIDKGLSPEVRKKIGLRLRFSDEGYRELDRMFLMTQENLRMAQTVFMASDRGMARKLVEQKVDIRNFERQSSQRHLMRLRDGEEESRETSSLHLDILRDLKRINAHAVSVSYPILDEEGLLFESRLRSERGGGRPTA